MLGISDCRFFSLFSLETSLRRKNSLRSSRQLCLHRLARKDFNWGSGGDAGRGSDEHLHQRSDLQLRLEEKQGEEARVVYQCVTCPRSTSQFCKYKVKAIAVYCIRHTQKTFIKLRGERRAHCMAESWLDSALFQGRLGFLLNSHSLCQPALSPNLHYSSQAWFTLFERSTTDSKASPEQPHYPSLVLCKHEGEKWSASFQEHAKFYLSFPSWRLRIS